MSQTFELTLTMKEEIENAREECLVKSDQLRIMEERYLQTQQECQFYLKQNADLIERLDFVEQ